MTSAVSDGQVRGPELVGEHSELAGRFWLALRSSGQAQFFEPSDWFAAELAVRAIDLFVESPTAALLTAIQSMMANLLVTEGDRRRLRVELERVGDDPPDAAVVALQDFRSRVAAGD